MISDNTTDTICAISTPSGTGGIAVIRVSGQDAMTIVNRVWKGRDLTSVDTHTVHLGELIDPESKDIVDQCVATVFKAPRSYTGENTVELAIHGSKWIQREALALLQRNGCRMAEAGEYTRRAVMNGRLDLAQAEGVADVIASSSRAAHRIAINQMKGGISRRLTILRERLVQLAALLELELDFSEEDVEFADRTRLIDTALEIKAEVSRLYSTFSKGNAIKEGIPVAIIGATNAGKSSLLNALLDDDRAIVSDIHGTTRDTIEESVEIGDYLFRFIDTAGLRETNDPIERIGIERSRKALSKARIVIALIDATTINADNINLTSLLPAELRERYPEITSTTATHETTDNNNTPTASILGQDNISCDIIIGLNKTDLVDANTIANLLEAQSTHSSADSLVRTATNIPTDQSHCIPTDNTMGTAVDTYKNQHPISNIRSILPLSATQGTGLVELRKTLQAIAADDSDTGENGDIMVTNLRQAEALRQALQSLDPLIIGLQNGLETDLAAQHLRETLSHLATITGEIPSTEILNTIFSTFCIGK